MIVTKKSTLKSYILESISQIEVFAKILDVPESTIENCLNGEFILNTLRNESNPSVRMMYVRDNTGMTKIRMTDFGDSRYNGDCFDLMAIKMRMMGTIVEVTRNSDFVLICKAILNLQSHKKFLRETSIDITNKRITDLAAMPREWNEQDIRWLGTFGMTPKKMELIVKCKPALAVFNDNPKPFYTYRASDPAYIYYLGKYKDSNLIKIYFPNRSKSSKYPRFITNNPFPFDDLRGFKPGNVLVLIKCLKDKAVLIDLLFKIPEFISLIKDGVTVDIRSVSSENTLITELQARVLQGLFDLIITCFDYDKQGIYTSWVYRKKYGFYPMMLTNGKYNSSFDYGAKDITAYRQKFFEAQTLVLLKDAIITIKQYYEGLATYR